MKSIFALLLFFSFFSMAQVNVDSLRVVWNDENKEDTVRLDALIEMVWSGYLYSQPDSAFYFAGLGYELALKKELKKEMAEMLTAQGVSFMVRGDYYNATEYHTRSLKIQEEIKDKTGISKTLNNIALISMKKGDYKKAIDYYNQSLMISEKINDKLGIARALSNIATMYKRLQDNDKSLDYHLRSLEICKELGNKNGMAICYNNIGVVYSGKEQFDKALEYYSKALAVQEELGNDVAVANAMGNIGRIYQLKGDNKSAVHYQKQSLALREKIGDREGIAGSLSNIAEVFHNEGNFDSAIIYNRNSLKIASEVGSASMVVSSAEGLYESYKETGQYKKALAMFELFVDTYDSLQSEVNQNEIIRQEYEYKYEQKRISDSLKNVQILELEKRDRQKAKNQRYALYTLVVFILLIVSLILRARSIKRNAEKECLLKEIEILKSSAVIYMASSDDTSLNGSLDRKKINAAIDGSLNDSDWVVLTVLCENPTINNREISEKISLSFEGVRSSLKKMYRIFDIQNTSENQRIALVIKAIHISNAK